MPIAKKRNFTSHDIKYGIAANEELICSVRDCQSHRVKLAALCHKHLRNQKVWGHHSGKFFKPKEVEPWIESAMKFIKEQEGHPGIRIALRWFKVRIDQAVAPQDALSSPRAELQLKLVLMRSAQIEPKECLARCIAVWMYSKHLRHVEPEVIRRNLASHVFYSMSPGCRASRAATRRLFGGQIMDALLPLFVRIDAYYRDRRKAAGEMYVGAQEPFVGEA